MVIQECDLWCQTKIYFAPLLTKEGMALTILLIIIYVIIRLAIIDYNKREKPDNE